MKVLILAHDCNPQWPSLPVVGYKAARAIADLADVTVATHVRNRPALEESGMGRARVVYLDNEYIARPLYRAAMFVRGGRSVAWTANIAMQYPAYLAFEREARKRFGPGLSAGEFDVVHRVTPMSPTLPSPLASRCPVPFVLGPLNGGLRWPGGFEAELRREREWLTHVRGAYRWLPGYRSTYARAAAILAAFPHTVADLPASCRDRVIEFPEVGIDPDVFAAPSERPASGPVKFLFAGRLVPYKCADVAIAAFAASPLLRQHRLLVVGDGPERERLEVMIRAANLESCVELVGWKSQAEVGAIMRGADVLAFPSIRELGAGVVVEAMASGLACIVVDYGGPGGLIDWTRGVKVPLGSKTDLVRGFTREMESLAADRSRIAQLGANARAHALEYYAWSAKAARTIEVYDWVLRRRSDKPVFSPRVPGEPCTAGVLA